MGVAAEFFSLVRHPLSIITCPFLINTGVILLEFSCCTMYLQSYMIRDHIKDLYLRYEVVDENIQSVCIFGEANVFLFQMGHI